MKIFSPHWFIISTTYLVIIQHYYIAFM